MHEHSTIFVYDWPCPDGLLGRNLASLLPLDEYFNGIIPIALTHPVSEDVIRKIFKNANKTNRIVFVDCALKRHYNIELAQYYKQTFIYDHHNEDELEGIEKEIEDLATLAAANGKEKYGEIKTYIDKSRGGSRIYFDEAILPVYPSLKRPLALDIVMIADLAIKDPNKIAALLGQDKIDALGLDKPEDLHYMLVSCLDSSIDYSTPDKAAVDLHRFQNLSLQQIVDKGRIDYPKQVAEAHRLLSNPSYIPIDLPGFGPMWVPFVDIDIHKNRFVPNDSYKYADIMFMGCKRKNGIYYLSIRTSAHAPAAGIPDAEEIVEYLRTTTFGVEFHGEKKLFQCINGGGRGRVACGEYKPNDARVLFPVVEKGDRRLNDDPRQHAVIRRDRIVEMPTGPDKPFMHPQHFTRHTPLLHAANL